MGAFAVFGVSRGHIREQVLKHASPGKGVTRDQFEQAIDEIVDKKFETKKARVRLSAEFDAPQFCVDWINAAGKVDGFRDLVIYARQPKKDKAGNLVTNKKGRQVISWQPYEVAW